jgi:N-acetylneuraminate lyase
VAWISRETNEFVSRNSCVVTPFDDGERFAAAAFERLLERLYAQGVHGIYVCGSTGEGLLQSVAQRKQIAEAAVRCSPKGKQVILHVGANNTGDAVELTRHAARIGVHAVSSLPPAGGYSFAEIHAYYQSIAAVSELPVLVYYFPEICPTVSSTRKSWNFVRSQCGQSKVYGPRFVQIRPQASRHVVSMGVMKYWLREGSWEPVEGLAVSQPSGALPSGL